MKEALMVIDYVESCLNEDYGEVQSKLGLSRVRNIAPLLETLISFYRIQKRGDIIWIKSCPWVIGYVHPNIERFYFENPEAEFYSNTIEGCDFHHIKPEKNEPVFEKNMYSAFSGTQGRLELYLQERNIEHLIICGVYSTGCVNATICEAFHHGFKLTIIRDCVETFDEPGIQEYQKYLINDWSLMYGKVLYLSDYIKNST